MSINKRFMLSSMLNYTWSKYLHNQTDKSSDNNSWIINRFTIVQRSFFILSIIILFWIIFIVIYMLSRLIIRLITNLKPFQFYYESPSISNEKICRAFVISSNQYGSFHPTCIPSPLIYRSDSLFSTNTEQTTSQQSLNMISTTTTNKTSLLEHYLKTYNPLKIDLTSNTVTTSIVKDIVVEQAPSDTDTRPISNCYAFNCTNKQKIYHGGRYVRLHEQENCSATMSIIDDRLSDCSTKLTSVTLPVLMVTDCSDSQRLHTDIIELNEDTKDKE